MTVCFFSSSVLIIAETEPTEPDSQTDRAKENVFPRTKGNVEASVRMMCVTGAIQLDKCDYITSKVCFTNQKISKISSFFFTNLLVRLIY